MLLLVGLGALLLIPGFPVVISAALAGVVLVVFVWAWWLFGRRTRSWGYAERSDDLLVTSGIMWTTYWIGIK